MMQMQWNKKVSHGTLKGLGLYHLYVVNLGFRTHLGGE